MNDRVNHPDHYNKHPSGVECIDIIEWFNFNTGCVIKYVWRAWAGGKGLEDLEKARWYLDREIERVTNNPDEWKTRFANRKEVGKVTANRIVGCFVGCGIIFLVVLVAFLFAVFVAPGIIEGVFSDIVVGLGP